MDANGIPEGASVERLIVDPESKELVALVDLKASGRPKRGIFFRSATDAYTAIVSPDDQQEIVMDAIPAAEQGGVLFSIWHPCGSPTAFRPGRLDLFHFSSRLTTTVWSLESLQFPRAGVGWLASLLHTGEGGRALFARVGFQEEDADGSREKVPYYIARIELASAKVELTMRLEHVYY